ncbi:hypothetical protein GCM10009425_31070 [Pseudomonas asuensis]|uniref:Uncharacterized protein n=1 Tax=Pseudomonas asuensis TaxID=1825787 RepID=A0ABQ2GYW2_9PSED|nr:hypothetical protein GCM10009425_31070 [Pseudomonas asuensis]
MQLQLFQTPYEGQDFQAGAKGRFALITPMSDSLVSLTEQNIQHRAYRMISIHPKALLGSYLVAIFQEPSGL